MIRKEDFDRIGGFDEDYRDGQAFDDTDFACRLHAAGMVPVSLDDLVCDHVRNGAISTWPEGAKSRNLRLFMSRWPSDIEEISCAR